MTESSVGEEFGTVPPLSGVRIITAKNVSFPPLPNGVDYLVSVVDLLGRVNGDPTPRDLKYAVLHLQAASEVLLKARLQIEHWTLVVKDAGKTKKQQYHYGDFESPTHAETIRRLVDVAGIDIHERDKRALLSLAKTRNSLQHWGFTESAAAVETRAADVLDFLIRFLDDELVSKLTEDELAQIEDDMLKVREGLTRIKSYIMRRTDRLRDELKDRAERVVRCPDCAQFALVVDGGENKCHFCPRLWAYEEVAHGYASEILNFSWHDISQGANPIVVTCPHCDTETLVLGTLTAAHPDRPVNLCFNCADVFDDLASCARCGEYYIPYEHEVICAHCWNNLTTSE